MAFDPRNLIRPLAPGLPGAVNPLAFIGAGMATGDMGSQLTRMGQLQITGQEAERKRKQQEAMTAVAPGVAQQLYPGNTAMQQLMAANPQLLAQAVQAQARPTAPTAQQRNLEAAGFAPGTPEFQQSMSRLIGLEETAAPADFKDVATVRQRYTKASQPWQESKRAFERIMATEPTGAGDIALLTSYMKVLDPGSTVREGEFATAEQAGGAPDWVRNTYNKLLTGERLNPEQRKQFKSQAAGFLDARRREQQTTQGQFDYWAGQRGMDLKEAVPDYLGEYAPDDWRKRMNVPVFAPAAATPSPTSPTGQLTTGNQKIDALMNKYLGP